MYEQLQWFEHVNRMSKKKMLEWISVGRRKRGRPRKTWIADVNEHMKEKGLEELDWIDREN